MNIVEGILSDAWARRVMVRCSFCLNFLLESDSAINPILRLAWGVDWFRGSNNYGNQTSEPHTISLCSPLTLSLRSRKYWAPSPSKRCSDLRPFFFLTRCFRHETTFASARLNASWTSLSQSRLSSSRACGPCISSLCNWEERKWLPLLNHCDFCNSVLDALHSLVSWHHRHSGRFLSKYHN